MNRLTQEDKEKLSHILHDNWDNVFELLAGSSIDEYDIPYKEVYRYELEECENDFLNLINTYLENNAFFNRESMRDWVIQQIVGGLLTDVDCRSIKFHACVNTLFNNVFRVIKPYYVDLYPDSKAHKKVGIIETNLSMNLDGVIMDHQSNIVEADSWEDYCKSFKEYDGKAIRFKSLIHTEGNTVNNKNVIEQLTYDSFHLSCYVWSRTGCLTK